MILSMMSHIEGSVCAGMENIYLDAVNIIKDSEICMARKKNMYQIQQFNLDRAKIFGEGIITMSELKPNEKETLLAKLDKLHKGLSDKMKLEYIGQTV